MALVSRGEYYIFALQVKWVLIGVYVDYDFMDYICRNFKMTFSHENSKKFIIMLLKVKSLT